MSKTSKRVLSWVMTVLMVVSMLSSFPAFAASTAFKDAYTCAVTENGQPVIGRDALLVSYSITEADGTTITRNWDGTDYTFVVGENAFATLPKALDHATAKGIKTPDIIMTDTKGGNLNVGSSCNIYAPNWNTTPYIRDAQQGEWKAVNSDGADWTVNPAYTAKEVIVNNVILDGTITGELGIYGFVSKDQYYLNGIKNGNKGSDGVATAGGYRTATTAPVHITFGNMMIRVSGVSTQEKTNMFGANSNSPAYEGNSTQYWGNISPTATDTLTFKDCYFDKFRVATQRSQFFPDAAMPANVVLDGCYLDYTDSNLKYTTWFKQSSYTKHTSITWKNCNIRNVPGGTNYVFEFAGLYPTNNVSDASTKQSSKIILDNNVYYNCKGSNSGVIYHRPGAYTDIAVTNNYFENPYSFQGMALLAGEGIGGSYPASSVKSYKVTGNKLLGFNSIDTIGLNNYTTTPTAPVYLENNFLVNENGLTHQQYADAVGSPIASATGLADGSTGSYYLDYDMTLNSADFALDVKIGDGADVKTNGTDIFANVKQGGASVTPTIKAKGADVAVKISTKADFSDTVTTFDTSVKETSATYYIRAYSTKNDKYYIDYKLTVSVEKSKEMVDFDSDNTYIINKDWTDDQLAGDADLTIWFQGADRTVNPKTDKLFNNYEDAYAVAFATDKWSVDNYLTQKPVFVFGPGDYSSSLIHLPAPSIVYGSNAGISPNADLDDDDWSVAGVKANNGWKANPNYNIEKETVLKVIVSTRLDNGTGTWTSDNYTDNFFGVIKEKAHAKDKLLTGVYVLDGFRSAGKVQFTGVDSGKTATWGSDSAKAVSLKRTHIILRNSRNTLTSNLIGAWSGTWEYNIFTLENIRSEVAISNIGERFVRELYINNSFFTGLTSADPFTKGLWTNSHDIWSSTDDARLHTGHIAINGSMIYNCSNSIFNINADSMPVSMKSFSFDINDSILYNAGSATWGTFRLFNYSTYKGKEAPIAAEGKTARTDRTIELNINNNLIYHDRADAAAFMEGNEEFIGAGVTTVNFNNNKIITPNTVRATFTIAPNTNYDAAKVNAHMRYNFDNNYWSDSVGGISKPVTFNAGAAPTGDTSVISWDWDYNNPVYYLDYDLKYKSTDAVLTAVDAGKDNPVTFNKAQINPVVITANILNKTGKIDASSFTVGANNTVTIKDGNTTVSSIDLTKVTGVKDYTVLVGIKGEAANIARTYTLRVIDGAYNFVDTLKNGGIKFGDKVFTDKNTAAMAPYGQSFYTNEKGQKYFYQYFDGVLYEYVIDNVNVFEFSTKSIGFPLHSTYKDGSSEVTTYTRTGIDFEKTKAITENGNLILAGARFNDTQFIFTFPISVYGLNAGINPVDKSNATPANDYAVALNKDWGKNGETKVNCTRVLANIDGTVYIDGITIADRVNDDMRWANTGTFNFVWKNIVYAGAKGGNMFNLANPRSTNGSAGGLGGWKDNAAACLNDAEFGKVYNDSIVLENFYHKSGATRHIFNEQVPANVTLKNYYVDNAAVGTERNLIGFMKTGALNVNSNITIEDCIFKGNSPGFTSGTTTETGVTNRVFHSEGARNAKSDVDYNININVNNNIFFKSGGTNYIAVKPSMYDSFKVTGNTFVADMAMNVYGNFGGAKDIADVTFDNNRYVGFENAKVNPTAIDPNVTETNSFATADGTAYKSANAYTGYQATAFGTNDYYVNFGMTAKASEYAITKFEAGTSGVSDVKLDAANRKIQFSLARGTTDGVSVVLAGDTARWYFSTDADGKNKIDVISREDLKQLVSTYYFNIDVNGVVLTYEMEILNDVVPDFADVEDFDPTYFSNKAVIVTAKAANLAVGTEIFEQWDGQWYRFYAGVNAFATLEDALKIDAEVAEVLITELAGDKYDVSKGSDQADISLTRSAKLFGPNYKTPAVVTDGFGYNSPSKGQAWGLNPEFVEKMDLVKFKTLSIQENAIVVEAYGLTIDRGVYDRYKAVGTDSSIKLVNTYFTNDNPTPNSFIFSYSIGNNNNNVDTVGTDGIAFNENNNSTLYVKNAYFDQVESGLQVRIIGEKEVSVANTTFEEIYLDASDEVGLGGNGNWLKAAAKNNAFTIKNSYLANWTEKDFQFKGYTNTSGKPVDIPEGYSNALTFDNNIFYNFAGHNDITNSRAALIKYNSRGFSEVNITNNYIVPVIDRTEIRCMFWDTSDIGSNEIKYAITGNVINGLIGGIYSGSGNNYNPNAHWDVSDNFVVTNYTENLDGVIGRSYTTNPTYKTMKYDWYRLSADGTLRSCDIQDMTWSDRVTFSGTTAIANIYDCDNIYTVTENANADDPSVIDSYTYKFDLSSLVKANKYGNRISVSYNGGEAVDLTKGKLEITRDSKIAPDTAIRVTVTVDSPDGRADEQTYTFVIFMNSGDAPAFKGTFKDDANIISNNAVIVTSAAAGATGTINAQWMGETYSFTVGTNAFATVEDALAAAKTANAEYAEIILPENTTAIDVLVSHPAKIYGVNYNTMPYTADGYGTDSPSLGANWAANGEYFKNETKVHSIAITADFPGGVFELHGATLTGKFLDQWRAEGADADIVLKNTTFATENLNVPAGITELTGSTAEGGGTKARFVIRLNNPANKASTDNSFTLKNVYLKKATGYAMLLGEQLAPKTEIDGLYVNVGEFNKTYTQSGASQWWKSQIDGTTFVLKNSNFYSAEMANYYIYFQQNGLKKNCAITYDNNIFNNVYSVKDGSGNPYLFAYAPTERGEEPKIELKNNYFGVEGADPYLFYISGAITTTDVPINVENNVFNGLRLPVTFTSGNNAPAAGDTVMSFKGNYTLDDYVANVQNSDAIGVEITVGSKNTLDENSYFALDYDRTLMSNVVGDMTVVDGKNIIIDEQNKTVTYAYDELVTKNASNAITVDLTAFTKLTNKYNSVVAVLSDGTEKDLSTIFTYDGATLGETITLKVYSYDKNVSKTTYTVTFIEGKHVMGDWEHNTDAGCGTNATEIRYCKADECTLDEGTCGHFETRDVEGSALPHQFPTTGYYNNDATCLADGTQTIYCKDCGASDVITAPGTKVNYHKYTNYVANNDGTCMVDGTMTAVCDWCDANASTVLNPEDSKEINADNHLYGEYIYNNDATCLADGTQTRYCIHEDAQGTLCGHADETITAEGTMIGHDWSEYVYNNDETCQNNGTETATCPGHAEENGVAPECGAQDTRPVEGTKLGECVFEEDAYVLTTEATCTTPGYETAPCKFAYDGCTATHTRLNADKYPINPDNHDYAKPVYQEDATCVSDGTQTRKCKREDCGFILTETAPGTAGQGTHVWGEYVANNDADCVNDGTMTAGCIADPNCTAKDTITNPADPAGKKAHTWGEYVYNNDATCVKDGTKTAICTVDGCGATDTEKDADHLKSTVAHAYTEWKSNNDATCTKDGTKTRECTADRCYHTETVTDEGTMKAHAWGEYKYNNDATYLADGTKTAKCTTCTATNTITAAGTKTPLKTIVNTASKFVDVKAGAWYKNAVDYAVTYGLISGTTATTFEPNGTITRGMFVTILARAAGVDTSAAANKAAKTQFTDVAAGKYYAAAIAWASSKQIVAGMTNTEFAPDAPIARQQLAVMIYRFASSQGVTLKAKKTVSFADAATVSTWAKDGVAACAAAGIVNGYTENGQTYFKPYKTATRAEATQMIYMFHAEYITGTIK